MSVNIFAIECNPIFISSGTKIKSWLLMKKTALPELKTLNHLPRDYLSLQILGTEINKVSVELLRLKNLYDDILEI